jgi:hypothetical protein
MFLKETSMRIKKNNDVWILKGMCNKSNTRFNTGFSLSIWQQEESWFITVFMITLWKFYIGIFLTKMPKRNNQ